MDEQKKKEMDMVRRIIGERSTARMDEEFLLQKASVWLNLWPRITLEEEASMGKFDESAASDFVLLLILSVEKDKRIEKIEELERRLGEIGYDNKARFGKMVRTLLEGVETKLQKEDDIDMVVEETAQSSSRSRREEEEEMLKALILSIDIKVLVHEIISDNPRPDLDLLMKSKWGKCLFVRGVDCDALKQEVAEFISGRDTSLQRGAQVDVLKKLVKLEKSSSKLEDEETMAVMNINVFEELMKRTESVMDDIVYSLVFLLFFLDSDLEGGSESTAFDRVMTELRKVARKGKANLIKKVSRILTMVAKDRWDGIKNWRIMSDNVIKATLGGPKRCEGIDDVCYFLVKRIACVDTLLCLVPAAADSILLMSGDSKLTELQLCKFAVEASEDILCFMVKKMQDQFWGEAYWWWLSNMGMIVTNRRGDAPMCKDNDDSD